MWCNVITIGPMVILHVSPVSACRSNTGNGDSNQSAHILTSCLIIDTSRLLPYVRNAEKGRTATSMQSRNKLGSQSWQNRPLSSPSAKRLRRKSSRYPMRKVKKVSPNMEESGVKDVLTGLSVSFTSQLKGFAITLSSWNARLTK